MSELGLALREAREKKGMSLDDIQGVTKIQKRYLSAIEAGEFDKLPGEFYTRAFIKNYAEAVGLDPKVIFNDYTNEIPKSRQEPVDNLSPRTRIQRTKTPSKRAKRVGLSFESLLPKIIIIVVLLAVLVGIYLAAIHFSARSTKPTVSQSEKSDISYKKDDTRTKKVKDEKKKDQTQKDSSGKVKKKEMKQSLALDKTEGSSSYYTLSNTDQFTVNIAAKPDKQTWIRARESDSKSNYAMGTAQDDKNFKFDATDANKIEIKIGNTLNTIIEINGKSFEFPTNTITQTIYITYEK